VQWTSTRIAALHWDRAMHDEQSGSARGDASKNLRKAAASMNRK
jgi:hypothetical protein